MREGGALQADIGRALRASAPGPTAALPFAWSLISYLMPTFSPPCPAALARPWRTLLAGWRLALLLGLAAATAQAQSTTYAYTGTPQTYTVPAGITAVQVVATGASGGTFSNNTNYSYGARVQATLTVTPGEVLTVVGGQGSSGSSNTVAGGYNGGGMGNQDGGGGGASDVRRATSMGSTTDYLTSRNALLVAGGGGGGTDEAPTAGGNGTSAQSSNASAVGGGATQTAAGSGGTSASSSFAAGSPGSNGTGGAGSTYPYGSGGGGGYYGGGGSVGLAGGGGGSSWVRPTGSTGISYSLAPATGNGALTITPVPLDDLVVSTAGQTVPAGLYNSLTVQSGGVGTLAARTYVATSTTVASGGTLDDGCATLTGPGSFTLAAGGTLRICSPDGISATGSTGSIQVTGTRSFSPDASYVYTRASVPVTGPGLPATVRALAFTTSGGGNFTLTLTNSVTATAAATLSNGALVTGANTLTLGPTATLSEDADGYVTGTVQTTRPLATAGATETFGGLGLTPSGATLPGSTLMRRVTGTALAGAGGSQSVKRYFDIQPTVTSGLNVALALTVRDDERNSIAGSRLRLFKSDDAGSTWQQQAAATFSSTAANGSQPLTYTASLGGISNFSLWTLGDVRSPLPVELSAFTATLAGPIGYDPTAVRLAWATASEKNSAAFEVERSADARIGTVAAAGSSSAARSYELLDARLPMGAALLYYRLKQVDADGTATYSPVRTVALTGAAAGLALYPNPTHGAATLSGVQAGAVVTVCDALGRPVTSATADAAGTAALALPAGLATGVYVVRAGAKALRLTVE